MASKCVEVKTTIAVNDVDLKKALKLPKGTDITSVEPIANGSSIRGLRVTFVQHHRIRFLKSNGQWR